MAIGALGALLALLFLVPWPHSPKKSGEYLPFEEPLPAPPAEEKPVPPPSPTPPAEAPPPVAKKEPVQPSPLAKAPATTRPRVAIIIDDMGQDYRLNRAFLDLAQPLSFAFLPHLRHTEDLARQAHDLERDVMVHLPMEPSNPGIDPGPGVLLTGMDQDTLLKVLEKDLSAVPFAKGANNHMGSKFTADERAMRLVMAEIGRRAWFFVDSRTSRDSVALDVARSLGVAALERSVFLDHDPRPKAIEEALHRLAALAREHGTAVAIGHPYESTLEVLSAGLPAMRRDIDIVPVSRLLADR